jgi:uncharacterized protein (DUF58 family)
VDRAGRAWRARHAQLSARSVSEGEALDVVLEAHAGQVPLPPGWMDEPLLDEPVRLTAGRRQARVRVSVTFERRGRRALAPPALVLRDPFGLAERVVVGAAGDEILVLPRIHPVVASATGGESSAANARAALAAAAAETEFDGLRPHQEGTPASRIHWATLARGANLMERKLIAEADSRPLVVLDPRGADTPEALDAAVRATGSLARHFALRQGCGVLLPGDRRIVALEPDLGGWPPLHVRLALLDDSVGPAFPAAQNRRGVHPLRQRPDCRPRAADARADAGRRRARGAGRASRRRPRARSGRLPRLRRRAQRRSRRHGGGAGSRMTAVAATRREAGGQPFPLSFARGRAAARTRGVRRAALDDARRARRAGRGWMAVLAAFGVICALCAAGRLTVRRARIVAARPVSPLRGWGCCRGRSRRVAAPGSLERAGRGHRAWPGVDRRRPGALPRPGRVDAHRHRPGRHAAAVRRGARGLLAPAGRPGRLPGAALVLLVTLYVTPAVALDFPGDFARGAVLTVLVLAFLRLDRVRLHDAPGAAMAAVAVAAVALLAAPILDRDQPWWDYETWALSAAESKSTTFMWEHDYGPLDWPRDGREVLRVKARQAAYWKADNLDHFDGARWRQGQPVGMREAGAWDFQLPEDLKADNRWIQTINVSVRNMRTRRSSPPAPPSSRHKAAPDDVADGRGHLHDHADPAPR